MTIHALEGIAPVLLTGARLPLFTFYAPVPGRITRAVLQLDPAAPVNNNGPGTFDVNRHDPATGAGVSIFAAPGDRPSIAPGQRKAAWAALATDNIAVAEGQKITVDADVIPGGGLGPLVGMVYVEDDAGVGKRGDVVLVTSAIAAGAILDTVAPLGSTSIVYRVAANQACRVRGYSTAAYRTADRTRPVGQPITGAPNEHGLLFEARPTAGNLAVDLAPIPYVVNMDGPPVPDIYLAVTNDGASGPLTITITRLVLEQ